MKVMIGKCQLQNTDAQAIEVPKGARLVSVVGEVEQIGGGLELANGQKAARVVLNAYIAFDPEEQETETLAIYTLGLGIGVEIPDTAQYACSCPVVGGKLVFHFFTDRMEVSKSEGEDTLDESNVS